jgi:hypothetical protein
MNCDQESSKRKQNDRESAGSICSGLLASSAFAKRRSFSARRSISVFARHSDALAGRLRLRHFALKDSADAEARGQIPAFEERVSQQEQETAEFDLRSPDSALSAVRFASARSRAARANDGAGET